MTTFIDIHILQDLPPSNINRDSNGTPKQARYGGVTRLRVSSQAWKRAARMRFHETMPREQQAVRTRRLVQLIADRLVERGTEPEKAMELAGVATTALGIKAGKKAEELSYLLFFGQNQLDRLVDWILQVESGELTPSEAERKAAVMDILGEGHPLDVALFGRMVADLANLNVDAATQVAHAISTHAANTEFDYFTAVDDTLTSDESGAGMIGTVEFNSATMYRYATVALEQLQENLGGDEQTAVDGIARFIESWSLSMPAGHQNTFAARTRPALVALVVREDQPVSLASSFETPISGGRESGLMGPSMRALAATYTQENERWGDAPVFVGASYAAPQDQEVARELEQAFGAAKPLNTLIQDLTESLAGRGQ